MSKFAFKKAVFDGLAEVVPWSFSLWDPATCTIDHKKFMIRYSDNGKRVSLRVAADTKKVAKIYLAATDESFYPHRTFSYVYWKRRPLSRSTRDIRGFSRSLPSRPLVGLNDYAAGFFRDSVETLNHSFRALRYRRPIYTDLLLAIRAIYLIRTSTPATVAKKLNSIKHHADFHKEALDIFASDDFWANLSRHLFKLAEVNPEFSSILNPGAEFDPEFLSMVYELALLRGFDPATAKKNIKQAIKSVSIVQNLI